MRERLTPKSEGNEIEICELAFPDDFNLTAVSELGFNQNRTRFTVGNLLHEDLRKLREVQLGDSSREYGILRIRHRENYYVTKEVIKGSNCWTSYCVGYDTWSKELYWEKHVFEEWPPTPIVDATSDFLHTHPFQGNADPMLSGLFSAGDIISLGESKAGRFWVIGADGTAMCLMNIFGRDFRKAGEIYFQCEVAGTTYDQTYEGLVKCVRACNLSLYKSDNLTDFVRLA